MHNEHQRLNQRTICGRPLPRLSNRVVDAWQIWQLRPLKSLKNQFKNIAQGPNEGNAEEYRQYWECWHEAKVARLSRRLPVLKRITPSSSLIQSSL